MPQATATRPHLRWRSERTKARLKGRVWWAAAKLVIRDGYYRYVLIDRWDAWARRQRWR